MENSLFGRNDRLIEERRHDTYRPRIKIATPAFCEECGAVYSKGRWTWGDIPKEAHCTTCPACQRTADHVPAGSIEVNGGFFAEHHDEIMNMVFNVEGKEKKAHPLERIMEIEETKPQHAIIRTTGSHIARSIGNALAHAYNGMISMQYMSQENYVRVVWHR